MNSRFFLLFPAAVFLAACDRQATEVERERAAELEQLHVKQQAADERIRELEAQELARLQEQTVQLAQDKRDAEKRSGEEIINLKQENERAEGRIRELEEQASQPAPVAEAARDSAVRANLERVVEEEDREPVYTGRVVPESQHVTSIQSFYEPLDPYGDWIETGDYGYVFRPQVAATVANWRPYTNGHWIHTDYGWTWESNEDFGWATYHYGRWARVSGVGWVWVPGREWGPAWVSWRRGNDYCGWAPLPPESRTRFTFTATVDRDYDLGPAAYIFISLTNFGAHSYVPMCAPPERNVTIIQNTVNITNINYNTGNNQTVVYNGGPNYNLVRARSKEPVEQVNVNFAQVNKTVNNTTINKTKIVNVRQGNTLQVAAPPAAAAVAPAPSKVKAKIEKPKVDKGWEGVDSAQVEKVRQQLAASSVERKHKPQPTSAVTPPVSSPAPANPESPALVPAEPAKVVSPTPKLTPLPGAPARTEVLPQPERETPAPKTRKADLPKVETPEPQRPKVQPGIPPTPQPRPEKPERPKFVPAPASTPTNQPNEERPKAKVPKADQSAVDATPVTQPEVPSSPKAERRSIQSVPATPVVNRPRIPVAETTPQSVRQPVPNPGRPSAVENAERNRERALRQPSPVVERPARPPQAAQPAQPQSSGNDPEKKKKKKEEGQ